MSVAPAILVGLIMGVVFSLLGAGGGILAIPVLLTLFHVPLAQATAASLVIVWSAALTGTLGHARGQRVEWRVVGLFGGPSVLGAVAGAKLHAVVPEAWTLTLFVGVLLAATVAFVKGRSEGAEAGAPMPAGWLLPLGLVLGVLTGFLGVGGGFLIVPTLVLLARLPLKQAIGTSMAVIALSSFSGAVTYALQGLAPVDLLLPVGGGAVVGALVGAPLSGKLPERPLKWAFVVLALSVSVAMSSRAVDAWRARAVETRGPGHVAPSPQ